MKHSPNFRVAHEPIAQADCKTVCVEATGTVVLGDGVHVGRNSGVDRVALHALLWGDTPAIVYAERRVSMGVVVEGEGTDMRQTLFLISTMVDGGRVEEATKRRPRPRRASSRPIHGQILSSLFI